MIKLIAGPCSAESRGVTLATAAALAELRPQFEALGFELEGLRASVWKPRTRPGNYEGPGGKALAWLAEAPLPALTEVGSPAHVDAALKAGIRRLWLGARTTTNPFDVQAIADALRGTDVEMFVKNPMNPDAELWIGGVERLYAAGIRKISLVHRGFSFYEKNKYRNPPKWQVPIDVMQMLPQFPMYCDPSHIGGDRAFLREISQKALDLGYAGLFIETHIVPDAALTDSRQQITPSQLLDLLKSLTIKYATAGTTSDATLGAVSDATLGAVSDAVSDAVHSVADPAASPAGTHLRHAGLDPASEIAAAALDDVNRTLEQLRTRIDGLDDSLLEILAERMKVSEAVGECKRAHNIQVLQPARWEEVLRRVGARARELGLDEVFVRDLYKLIHTASIDKQ